MKKPRVSTLLAASLAGATALLCLPASAMDILARVISSTPVVQQVAVPRQVCNNQAYVTQAPRSGAGALMGALAGGAAGNAMGDGGGRAAATMLGLFGGAILGDRIEGGGTQVQNVQQCTTQTFYENRASHYNVVYEYQGAQYNAQMQNDPGLYVRLQVTPVGAMAPAAQTFPSAPTQQPQAYYPYAQVQPAYAQPVVVAPAYPGYYAQPYYAPAYAPTYAPIFPPIGLSLNFGYSRGYGGHRHWR